MPWEKPTPDEVWRAIHAYLKAAYPAAPPAGVRARLEALAAANEGELFDSSAFENQPDGLRICLRLGNRFYPHMKLVIEAAPDGKSYLFRADTHDKHCRPAAGSKEYAAFCELMEANQQTALAIESAWAEAGLPTFKQYLRRDLARRVAAATGWRA